jgi:7-carboxy-7-deazaguanine synthase
MRGLRLTDLYVSIQGEGPRVGWPTTFIRFGGCNMRCPGWPCDTPYAIEPALWKNDPVLSPAEVMERIYVLPGTSNYCITGGEPTMQPTEVLTELALVHLMAYDDATIDVFTNGSLKVFPPWMMSGRVSIVLDWKLGGSGEADRGLLTRVQNVEERLGKKDWIKLVIATEQDMEEAVAVWDRHRLNTLANWCAGSAWQKMSEQDIAEFIVSQGLPWRLNVQMHKYILGTSREDDKL